MWLKNRCMNKLSVKGLMLALLVSAGISCTPEEGGSGPAADDFDRQAMLAFWADDYIVPAYSAYHQSLLAMQGAAQAYTANPSAATHAALYAKFRQAYLHWQEVSLFEIGKAEALKLRNNTNIYPADTSGINGNIKDGTYNLNLPSTYDEQGFPAIDYLLSGLGNVNTTNGHFINNPSYGNYLLALINRLENLTDEVLTDWQTGYRNTFVENSGSSATASANKLINDYVFHFEKELRAGKIGIPAGVFSGNTLPTAVEAFHSDTLSKSLFMASAAMHQKFFEGFSYDRDNTGPSLKAYLNYLNVENGSTTLSDAILQQMNKAQMEGNQLNKSFRTQVENNNTAMLATYDELQKAVVLLKVDMMQALNVRVDYIDADGD